MHALLRRPSLCVSGRLPLNLLRCARFLHPSLEVHAENNVELVKRAKGQRTISLLEELFPQAIKRKHLNVQKKTERHVPRLALDVDLPSEAFVPKLNDDDTSIEAKAKSTFRRKPHNQHIALLVLHKASKFLIESDFRRAAPSGKHIEGWAFKGDVLKVIRGRDTQTLEPNGTYFLLFENPTSAQAYKDHAIRLHRSSQAHLPQGMTGPLPTPPSLNSFGQVSYGPAETFTLVPSFQDLDLRMMIQPFSPVLREVIDNLGYKQLVTGKQSNHEVLITIHWLLVSLRSLRHAVRLDGEERGCHWDVCYSPGSHRAIRPVRLSEKHAGTMERQASGVAQKGAGQSRVHGKKHFIISLKDDAEAKRFAFSWHRREISRFLDEELIKQGEDIMVDAEVIW